MKLSIWFNKLQIKFLMWRRGKGFTMPSPYPLEICMYNYCKSIINDKEYAKIEAYENKINSYIERFAKTSTKKDVAKYYIEALELVYGKEKF